MGKVFLFTLAAGASLAILTPAMAQYSGATGYVPPASVPGYGSDWRDQRTNQDWRNNTWREQQFDQDWRNNGWRQQRANEDWKQREEYEKRRTRDNAAERGYGFQKKATKQAEQKKNNEEDEHCGLASIGVVKPCPPPHLGLNPNLGLNPHLGLNPPATNNTSPPSAGNVGPPLAGASKPPSTGKASGQ